MPFYTSFGEVQAELKAHYSKTGERLQFQEALEALYRRGGLSAERPPQATLPSMIDHSDPESFSALVDSLSFSIPPGIALTTQVQEIDMFPSLQDVYIIRHPRYTRPYRHRHDYVEVDCVVEGRCNLYFEDEVRQLQQGSLCLIAPASAHDIEILDESTVYCIMLRRSTFETTFYSLLTREDALALFFRMILHNDREPNYLLFQADSIQELRMIIQNAMLECFRTDSYSNSCCISYVNLLFARVLRSSGDSPQFYHYQMSADFSMILHYIRHHYQNLTLCELADRFHYSKPHLCTLIKQSTGMSFTNLIKQIRMARAVDYLTHTEMQIGEIAELVGYHSADHFSRVFRTSFSCSPQEYRRLNQKPDDRFIPFEMK